MKYPAPSDSLPDSLQASLRDNPPDSRHVRLPVNQVEAPQHSHLLSLRASLAANHL